MRNHKYAWSLSLLLASAALCAGLYIKLYYSASGGERSVSVVLKSSSVRSSFWQAVSAGAAAAAKEAGATIDIQGPLQESDAETQIRLLHDALAARPSSVVVAPVDDPRVSEAVHAIRRAGIRVVVIDMPLLTGNTPVSVLNDHLEAGRQAGETAAGLADGSPNVAIVGDFESSRVSREREAGVKEAVGAYPGGATEIYYCEDSEDKAYQIMQAVLAMPEPPGAVVALNEPAALGAARAIVEAGDQRIKLIGFDSSVYEIRLLEDGIMSALIVQKPFNMGYLGVKAALRRAEPKGASRVAYTDSVVVTKSNMYTPENQKLLFPFDGEGS
ncbi:substrate-binding domain-containing protein [Cohnella sp. JJ-181]|uniref:substrate-binding domain-containing protein n=1 Tax=Cohnella rhizoplanae TaxID=2974897 RepID=UPI0022FF8031|nr:substrate-binding domain-containing protein [Cohnella sp. JJ-181]CAI6082105.1 Ribose import binding protein RbsB [Cohnella sp. JJ-181]